MEAKKFGYSKIVKHFEKWKLVVGLLGNNFEYQKI
jgi:hypothetical protein